jgi:hypothetical protein
MQSLDKVRLQSGRTFIFVFEEWKIIGGHHKYQIAKYQQCSMIPPQISFNGPHDYAPDFAILQDPTSHKVNLIRLATITVNLSPLGTSQPLTQNTPLTSINSRHVMGKEASTPIQEPSALHKIQSLPFPWENPPLMMEQPTFNRKNVHTQSQPTALYFEDLPIVDYNTFGTDNFHQEVKVTEFNYRDKPMATADCNNFASKDSHQGSQYSIPGLQTGRTEPNMGVVRLSSQPCSVMVMLAARGEVCLLWWDALILTSMIVWQGAAGTKVSV